MKEDINNPGNNHYDNFTINDEAEGNVLGGNKDFYGFDNNDGFTSKADKAYMDVFNKLIGSGVFPSYSWGRTGFRNFKIIMSTTPSPLWSLSALLPELHP